MAGLLLPLTPNPQPWGAHIRLKDELELICGMTGRPQTLTDAAVTGARVIDGLLA